MRLLFLFLFIISLGCSSHERKTYELSDGHIVHCLAIRQYCGAYLYDCDDGMIYHCQTNVKELK